MLYRYGVPLLFWLRKQTHDATVYLDRWIDHLWTDDASDVG
jgi:hypothetical protein